MPVDRGAVTHLEMPINQRHGLEAASWNLLLELKQVGRICLLLFYFPRYSENSDWGFYWKILGKGNLEGAVLSLSLHPCC